MSGFAIVSPLLPLPLLGFLALLALAPGLWALRQGARGAVLRLLAALALIVALLDPRLIRQDIEPARELVLAVIDQSASQLLGQRPEQTRMAEAELEKRLQALKGVELRKIAVGPAGSGGQGTRAFEALGRALADAEPGRLAAVIMITDGQIHDAPARLPFNAPLHVLLTGEAGERDRRIVIEEQPAYGLVGGMARVRIKIEDNVLAAGAPVEVQVRRDGVLAVKTNIPSGRAQTLEIPALHPGGNLIEIETPAVPGELGQENNRAALTVSGVRDRLKVLLISGEPHPGTRTWRNLLKSDPAVDLVHFTILRESEKEELAAPDEVSLIAFPVRELFEERLGEFDLVIFDRYRRRGILQPVYYLNLARYVRKGGALLISAGAEFASPASIYRSALEGILPAMPTSRVIERPFKPEITGEGKRHPVMEGLAGGEWGRWLRQVELEKRGGKVLMSGEEGLPLLLVDRVGEGRVALLASDSPWLWARGFEGGGPQAELLRRLAHWLMKEPELEEEALTAQARGNRLVVERRSLEAGAPPVAVTSPSGKRHMLEMTPGRDGKSQASLETGETGLWRVEQEGRAAVASIGSDPLEMADLLASPARLKPLAEASGGGLFRLAGQPFPEIVRRSPGAKAAGPGWMGLKPATQGRVVGVAETPLLPPPLALFLVLGLAGLAWWREGA
jgi:hypothetical protein